MKKNSRQPRHHAAPLTGLRISMNPLQIMNGPPSNLMREQNLRSTHNLHHTSHARAPPLKEPANAAAQAIASHAFVRSKSAASRLYSGTAVRMRNNSNANAAGSSSSSSSQVVVNSLGGGGDQLNLAARIMKSTSQAVVLDVAGSSGTKERFWQNSSKPTMVSTYGTVGGNGISTPQKHPLLTSLAGTRGTAGISQPTPSASAGDHGATSRLAGAETACETQSSSERTTYISSRSGKPFPERPPSASAAPASAAPPGTADNWRQSVQAVPRHRHSHSFSTAELAATRPNSAGVCRTRVGGSAKLRHAPLLAHSAAALQNMNVASTANDIKNTGAAPVGLGSAGHPMLDDSAVPAGEPNNGQQAHLQDYSSDPASSVLSAVRSHKVQRAKALSAGRARDLVVLPDAWQPTVSTGSAVERASEQIKITRESLQKSLSARPSGGNPSSSSKHGGRLSASASNQRTIKLPAAPRIVKNEQGGCTGSQVPSSSPRLSEYSDLIADEVLVVSSNDCSPEDDAAGTHGNVAKNSDQDQEAKSIVEDPVQRYRHAFSVSALTEEKLSALGYSISGTHIIDQSEKGAVKGTRRSKSAKCSAQPQPDEAVNEAASTAARAPATQDEAVATRTPQQVMEYYATSIARTAAAARVDDATEIAADEHDGENADGLRERSLIFDMSPMNLVVMQDDVELKKRSLPRAKTATAITARAKNTSSNAIQVQPAEYVIGEAATGTTNQHHTGVFLASGSGAEQVNSSSQFAVGLVGTPLCNQGSQFHYVNNGTCGSGASNKTTAQLQRDMHNRSLSALVRSPAGDSMPGLQLNGMGVLGAEQAQEASAGAGFGDGEQDQGRDEVVATPPPVPTSRAALRAARRRAQSAMTSGATVAQTPDHQSSDADWAAEPNADGATSPSRVTNPHVKFQPRKVMKQVVLEKPKNINFTQGSIRTRFHDGRSIYQTLNELQQGVTKISDIPKVWVIKNERDGSLWSLNNRRLHTFKTFCPDEEIEIYLLQDPAYAIGFVSGSSNPRKGVELVSPRCFWTACSKSDYKPEDFPAHPVWCSNSPGAKGKFKSNKSRLMQSARSRMQGASSTQSLPTSVVQLEAPLGSDLANKEQEGGQPKLKPRVSIPMAQLGKAFAQHRGKSAKKLTRARTPFKHTPKALTIQEERDLVDSVKEIVSSYAGADGDMLEDMQVPPASMKMNESKNSSRSSSKGKEQLAIVPVDHAQQDVIRVRNERAYDEMPDWLKAKAPRQDPPPPSVAEVAEGLSALAKWDASTVEPHLHKFPLVEQAWKGTKPRRSCAGASSGSEGEQEQAGAVTTSSTAASSGEESSGADAEGRVRVGSATPGGRGRAVGGRSGSVSPTRKGSCAGSLCISRESLQAKQAPGGLLRILTALQKFGKRGVPTELL